MSSFWNSPPKVLQLQNTPALLQATGEELALAGGLSPKQEDGKDTTKAMETTAPWFINESENKFMWPCVG